MSFYQNLLRESLEKTYLAGLLAFLFTKHLPIHHKVVSDYLLCKFLMLFYYSKTELQLHRQPVILTRFPFNFSVLTPKTEISIVKELL